MFVGSSALDPSLTSRAIIFVRNRSYDQIPENKLIIDINNVVRCHLGFKKAFTWTQMFGSFLKWSI